MKIVYSIAGTYNSGGMERVLANKANYLVDHGYEVSIVTTDQRGQQPFFPLDERITCYDLDINYEENNGKSFLNKLVHYPFKQLKHKQRLSRILKKQKADIVISMFCNDANILPSIHDGSRKLLEIHFSRFKRLQYGRKGFWKLADEWRSRNDVKTVARFNRFIVLTQEDLGYWGNLHNIQVIPNARTFVCEKPAALMNKKVIAVGRYNYQKGLDRLIDAWAIVCKDVKEWQLELIGEGELKDTLTQQIASLGLTDRVVLKRVLGEQMKQTYQEASILALSSYYEGLPMVLLEAQAAGLPVVSFACKCGPKDVIDNGVNGFLVPEGDVNTLAEKLLVLIKDEELRKRMGAAAFENSKKFSEEVVMNQWMSLFNEISNGTSNENEN